MYKLAIHAILLALAILLVMSCSKEITDTSINSPAAIQKVDQAVHRKIQFCLFTDRDFSKDKDTIRFTLFMQNSRNKILWDSALAPMQVKDIPDSAHRIIITKKVPGNNMALLKVGFRYSIQNVGNSSYIDTSAAGEILKIVNFNFH
jgi:hypothetical protein